MRGAIVLAALWTTIVACGDDDSTATGGEGGAAASSASSTSASSTSTSSTSGGGTSAEGGGGHSSCDDDPFAAVAEDAGTFQGVFRYVAQSTLSAPVDVLSFELLDGAPASPSMLTITADGYEACSTCVVLYLGCDENLSNCQQTLLAQSGTLDVTNTGESGGTFAGQLLDAELIEVEIDPNTFVSTPVAGGASMCWSAYDFSATIQ